MFRRIYYQCPRAAATLPDSGVRTAVNMTRAQGLSRCGHNPWWPDWQVYCWAAVASLEAAILQHLQILLVQFLLGFKDLLQFLDLPLAQLFAFSVVGRQTLQGPHKCHQFPVLFRPHPC